MSNQPPPDSSSRRPDRDARSAPDGSRPSPDDAAAPDGDHSTLPPAAQLHLWQIQGVRDVVTILALVGIVYVGYWMRSVTVPLLIALVLAYLFEPVVQRLCRFRGITRPGAVLIILLTVGVGVTVAGTLTIPRAIGETVNLVRQVRTGQFNQFADRLVEFAPEEMRTTLREFVGWFRGSAESKADGKTDPNADADDPSKAGQTPDPKADPSTDGAGDRKATTGDGAPGEKTAAPKAPSDTDVTAKDPTTPAATSPPPTPAGAPKTGSAATGTGAGTSSTGVVRDLEDDREREEREAAARRAFEEDERVRAIVRAELDALGLAPIAEHDVAASAAPSGLARVGSAPWKILGALGSTVESVGQFLLWIVQLSLLAFLVPFYFYFFSVSFPMIVDFGRGLIPEKNRARWVELIAMMDRAVSGFVRGRIVIAGIMGAMFAIGWIFCGVPYAITLGLLVGAMSLVPYLGGIGLPLAVGFLLFDQLQLDPSMRMSWWAILLWPSVVFLIVQTVESYVLTPMIAGKATDLDPVTIVVAILAGGSVAGVYGMILAIPAAACGKILLREVVLPRVRAWSRGEVSDPLPLEQKE
jgi:predicted PurR-regulated permease PerM